MNNRQLETALSYHEATKHSYASVRRDLHFLDWSNQPLPFKIFRDLDPFPLPRQWEESGVGALSAISTVVDPKEKRMPDLQDLARLLYFSAGITRRREHAGGEILFRAASCTGALYEIDLYLVCRDLPDLRAGVYHFSPHDFSLRALREGDYRGVLAAAAGEERHLLHAPLVIVSTGTYWRNAWKYRARTYRHFGWDNGTITANLLAISASLGLSARVVLGFVDEIVNRLLDLETDREVALALVPVGWTAEAVSPSQAELPPLGFDTVPLSRQEVDYPQMRAMHGSTCLLSPQEAAAWRAGSAQRPAGAEPQGRIFRLTPDREKAGRGIEETIMRRGSSRQFERRPLSFEQFSTLLHRSSQPVPADFLDAWGASLNDWYLIVHAVEGLAPGAYYFHTHTGRLELLKEGAFRSEAGYLGLEQDLPADASVAIFFLADLDRVLEAFGNRGYRAVQLEAGILGGRIYLAAYAQRLGATGLTFYDDEVIKFFSPHATGKSTIFLMAVGHGKKRTLLSL